MCGFLAPIRQEKEESGLQMKTKRKITKRKMLSVLLSVALLVSMLPLSGGQVAKAADGYPVKYMTKTDTDGKQYISITGMASNYTDFIDDDGTLTIPGEIEGKPVKEISGDMEIYEGKKLILPASFDRVGDKYVAIVTAGGSIEEIYFMCEGSFQSNGASGLMCLADGGDGSEVTDIYFRPTSISGNPDELFDAFLTWGSKFSKGLMKAVTLHLSSQLVLDKFNENAAAKSAVADGALILKLDLEPSEEALLAAKRQALAQKVAQGEKVTPEEDYTKDSWAVL